MDEFNKEIQQIGLNNASEINGDLRDYFSLFQRADGSYKIVWEKNVSTHIRHKVTAVVKKHYVTSTK